MRRSLMLWKQMELSHQGRNEAEGDGEVGGMGPLFFIFLVFIQASERSRLKTSKGSKCVRSAAFLFFKTVPPGQRKYE